MSIQGLLCEMFLKQNLLGFICLFIFNKAVFVLSSVDIIGKES